MWLQLTLGLALAGDEAGVRTDVYSDGFITVVSPRAAARQELREGLTLDAGWNADVISGATAVLGADVVSGATHIEESRQGAELSLTRRPAPTWAVSGSYTGSWEGDYRVNDGGLALEVELLERMATLGVSLHLNTEAVGRTDDPAYLERTLGRALNLSWTHILDRRTVAALTLTGQWATCGDKLGCHANPYRVVPLVSGDEVVAVLPERHPDTRGRGAAGLRLSRAFGQDLALHASWRGYADTWGLTGHTGRVVLAATPFDGRGLVRGETRLSAQQAAAFRRTRYDFDPGQQPAYRSADRELADLVNLGVGGSLGWRWQAVGPLLELDATARVLRLRFWYPDDPALDDRRGWLVGGGLDARW